MDGHIREPAFCRKKKRRPLGASSPRWGGVPLIISVLTLIGFTSKALADEGEQARYVDFQNIESGSETYAEQEVSSELLEDTTNVTDSLLWDVQTGHEPVEIHEQPDPRMLEKAHENAEMVLSGADEDGKTPLRLPSGFSGKSGVTAQSLALPEGSGSIQGMGESFSPNLNTGSGTFSVPISIPSGRRGLQPKLGLAYTSGGGDGPLGWGWTMGVPFISRQTDKGLPLYNKSDRFMYNGGQELVPVLMPDDEAWPSDDWNPSVSGDDITYFRARIQGGFMRFFYNRYTDTWLVQDRQGNHFYFGETYAHRMEGPKGTYQWSLSRLADVRRATGNGGNDVHYVYLEDGGNLYLKDIYWNSYEQEYGVLEKYQHNVRFVYEPRCHDPPLLAAKVSKRHRASGAVTARCYVG